MVCNLFSFFFHSNNLPFKKRHLYLASLFILIHCVSFAQDEKNINPDGFNTFYFPNGVKSSEGTLKNGKPDGNWKSYHENGKLKSEGNRKAHQLDSLWKFYNEEGILTAEYNYTEGLKNGLQKNYYDTGILQSEQTDSMGIVHGIKKQYNETGFLEKTIPFVSIRYELFGAGPYVLHQLLHGPSINTGARVGILSSISVTTTFRSPYVAG